VLGGALAALLTGALAASLAGCRANVALEGGDAGRPYACAADAGAGDPRARCAEGWVCGIDDVCHPEGPGPWACDPAANAPDAGANAACAPEDKCGLDGRCHDDTPRAYQCRGDFDCEGGWRCGPQGACLDPVQEALQPAAAPGAFSVQALASPLSGLPEHLAATPVRPLHVCPNGLRALDGGFSAGCRDNVRVHSLAVAQGDTLLHALRLEQGVFSEAPGVLGPDVDLLVEVPAPDAGVAGLATAFGPATDAGTDGLLSPQPVALDRQGTLWRYRFARPPWHGGADGGSPAQVERLGLALPEVGPNARLGALDYDPDPAERDVAAVLVYGERGFAEVSLHPNYVRQAGGTLPAAAGTVRAVAGTSEGWVAATSTGFWTAPARGLASDDTDYRTPGGPGFSAVATWTALDASPFGHAACGTGLRYVAEAFHLSPRFGGERHPMMGVLSRPAGGGAVHFSEERGDGPRTPACGPLAGTNNYHAVAFSPPCQVCEAGEEFLWGAYQLVTEDELSRRFVARCRSAAGRERIVQVRTRDGAVAGQACERSPFTGELARQQGQVRASGPASRAPAFATARDVWTTGRDLDASDDALLRPLGLDRTPVGITRVGPGEADGGERVAFTAERAWRQDARRGWAPLELGGGFRLFTSVRGKSQWIVTNQGGVVDVGLVGGGGPPPLVVGLDPTVARELPGPHEAELVRGADGGSTLLVSTNDSLLGADVTDTVAGTPAELPRLGVRLSPLPRTPISSFTTVAPYAEDGSGLVARGYALTPNGLFEFRASTPQRFRATPVEVPDGDWVRVFSDGVRGRIGYRDGRVLSLPSVLEISPKTPEPVVSYLHHCGRTYALGESSLSYLDVSPTGGPVGVWKPVPLGEATFGATAPFAGGRLLAEGETLFLVGRDGRTVTVRATAACPASP
jgi:hypothetical protein